MAILRVGCAAAILAMVPLAAQNQTTFFQAYEEGQAAQRRGDHAFAVAAFRRALELRPQSSARLLTYGNNFTSYYPQVYLAESLLALGKLDEAAQALEASARSKVEPPYLREKAEQRLKELRAARKPVPPAVPAPTPAVAAQAPSKEIPKKSPDPLPIAQDRSPGGKSQPPSQPTGAAQERPQAPMPKPAAPATAGPILVAPAVSGSATVPETPASGAPAPGPGQEPLAEASQQLSRMKFMMLMAALAAALVGLGYGLFRWNKKRRRQRGQMDQRTVAMSQPISADVMARLQHLPTDLGPYTLERVLGQGSFAT
ncbi:MAG: hypothetical protein KGN80_01430, partial [Acidobacteriota bacterium]|nr:hypothetical protein [Acidobacteriota bacterium]